VACKPVLGGRNPLNVIDRQRTRRRTCAWHDAPVRAVVQRVSEARVVVGGDTVGELTRPGLVVLVGVTHSDTASDARLMASKLYHLRILEGEKYRARTSMRRCS
jgi:hypothetical protein